MNGPVFDSLSRPHDAQIRNVVAAEFDGNLLIARGSANTKRRFHVPDGDEPLCKQHLQTAEWSPTTLTVRPPGHVNWCVQCLAHLFPEKANITVEVIE